MPSFMMQRRLDQMKGKTIGEVHKFESDSVMEATWYNDMDAKTAWFYDQYHDEEFDVVDDLHPEKTRSKIPVEVKVFEMEYNSLSKDETALHLLFKPSYEPNIPYYDEMFAKPLGSTFPIGLYFDYPDSKNIYHRYLVVGQYRHYSNQFPTYLVLPCDFKAQWIYKNKKYESWAVLRSQSSYNSGLWVDFKFSNLENQKLMWLPFNSITKTIFYDQRIAVSQDRDIPVVWKCSKVEDMNVKGIARYTFAQQEWDAHTDYIERDEDGNVLGIWCDYYTGGIHPQEPEEQEDTAHIEMTYSGSKQEMRIGGSYKKFTVKFYGPAGEDKPYQTGNWTFTVNGEDVSQLVTTLTSQDSDDVAVNEIKAKFGNDDTYIGEVLKITFTSASGLSASVEMSLTI